MDPEKIDFAKIAALGRRKSGVDKKYATFNRRMIAATLDSLLLMVTAPLFNRIFPLHTEMLQPPAQGDPDAARLWLMEILTNHDFIAGWLANTMAQLLLFLLYSGVCWHYWSATPGKMLLRIKVVDAETKRPISDLQIVLRLIGYVISSAALMMGFFWIGLDKRRQGWHDKLADTVVIALPWKIKSDSATAGPSDSPAP